MGKVAYVSITYLLTIEPSLVGLDEDCSEKEFSETVDNHLANVSSCFVDGEEIFPNDIEVDICGF